MTLPERFRHNIRRLREGMGFSQTEVAERIGVTMNTYSRWELGQVVPTLETIDRVAAALGVDVMELLEEEK